METIESAEGVYRPVGFGGATLQQFKLLWLSKRPLLLALGLVGVLVLAGEPWNDSPLARFFTAWPFWLILAGPFWGFAVFHNEGPSHRLYLWSQPVARDLHALARLTAGLAWLWLLYGLLIVAGLLFGLADNDVSQFAALTPMAWLNYFTAPLIGYLAISVLTVLSDYPLRWFFGIIFLVPLTLSVLDEWLGWEELVRTLLEPLGNEDWGLGLTMVGPFARGVTTLERGLRDMGPGNVPALEYWWVAMPLWALFFGSIVALLARRHPDVLPRWRRAD